MSGSDPTAVQFVGATAFACRPATRSLAFGWDCAHTLPRSAILHNILHRCVPSAQPRGRLCSNSAIEGAWQGPTCENCAVGWTGPLCRQRCPAVGGVPCAGHGSCGFNGSAAEQSQTCDWPMMTGLEVRQKKAFFSKIILLRSSLTLHSL